MKSTSHNLLETVSDFKDNYQRVDDHGNGFLRIYRKSEGEGRPIVLMPGASGTPEFFSLIVDPLERAGFCPSVIDYSGSATPAELARSLNGYLKRDQLEKPVIVGCSYSAWWLQLIAPEFDEDATLVFSNGFVEVADLLPNPLFDFKSIDETSANELQSQWKKRSENGEGPVAELVFHAMNDWLSPEDLKGRLMNVASASALDVKQTKAGILIMDCHDDPIVPAKARGNFRARWPGATVRSLEGGHYPYVSNPKGFVEVICAV